jgi:hypothetical protein
MNIKLILAIILASISSMISVGGLNLPLGPFFLFTFVIYFILNSFLIRGYIKKLTKNGKSVKNGLVISLIFLAIFLFTLSNIDINYELYRTDSSTTVYEIKTFLFPIAYLLAALLLSTLDSFIFHLDKLSKKRIFIYSFGYYILSYISGYIIGIFLAGGVALSG